MASFGPVLTFELRRLVRKELYFRLRIFYAAGLLAILFVMYGSHPLSVTPWWASAPLASDLAERFFWVYLLMQFVLVVLLTPAAAGSAISEERERHTLDDLLTTDLDDREIVLGKFLARTIHLALFLLTGLPILSLVFLLGGVSPGLLWGGFAATGLTLLSIASLSLCFSVYAAKSRSVFVKVYLILVGYFLLWGVTEGWEYVVWCLPAFAWDRPRLPLASGGWRIWPAAILEVLNAGNFLEAYKTIRSHVASKGGTYAEVLPAVLAKYAAFHAIVTVVCLSRAVTQFRLHSMSPEPGLRVAEFARFRRAKKGEFSRIGQRFLAGRRLLDRFPVCWKEIYAENEPYQSLAGRLFVGPLALACLLPAVVLLWDPSWATQTQIGVYIRTVAAALGSVALLAVGLRAAGSLGTEHDRSTLVPLLATPLTDGAIWWGKWLGSVLCARWLLPWALALWLLGIIGGGVHPLAAIVAPMVWCVYAGLFASLGLFFGAYARSTVRAIIGTALTGVVIGGGPWLCYFLLATVSPFADVLAVAFVICGVVVGPAFPWILFSEMQTSARRKTPVGQVLILLGCCFVPWLLAVMMLLPKYGQVMIDSLTPPLVLAAAAYSRASPPASLQVAASLCGLGLYLAAATGLGYGGRRLFPHWCGRKLDRRRRRKRDKVSG